MVGHSHDVGTRIQALALVEYGVPTKVAAELTGLSIRSINRLKKTAQERGYDPEKSKVLLKEYVADAPRSGRPKTSTFEKKKAVPDRVKKDRYDRGSGGSGDGGGDSTDDASETAAARPATQRQPEPVRGRPRDSGGGDSRDGGGGDSRGTGGSRDDVSEAAAAGPARRQPRDSGGGDSRGSGDGDSRDNASEAAAAARRVRAGAAGPARAEAAGPVRR
ncbi:MAG: hypothetical protein FRX48_08148 [Lasallia pustulata]|uniref:Uncharacterized protein n=1 Tax=Lasallia pustulata TaxID=136370 RepID=A0A5M8PEL8_9LECA|nr:MAG: hypothetical protein FRX48_08148 [Lasallia pustulata]